MLLRFVAGRAGSGKSTWVYEAVKRDMAGSDRPVYVIVPEQYTLQTEKELLAALGARGFWQVRVQSPTRLAGEVFAQVEQDRRAVVGECGLAMALRAVASKMGEDLCAFRAVLGYGGFSAGMVQLIAQMKRFDVTPGELLAASENAKGALKAKVQDIAALYSGYTGYLDARNYMDGEDRFNGFISAIARADFLKGCNFYFDGFDSLSPQHCRLIGELLAVSGSVSLTLDYDGYESGDAGLFRAAEHNIARLSAIADELGAPAQWVHVRADTRKTVMPPDIAHLERSLFSHAPARQKALGGVTLCRAADVMQEVEAAAAWIWQKVRLEGLRWREVAVQCGDLAAYGAVVGRVFGRWGIPAFIDSRKAVIGHPAVRFTLALIRVLERDYRADDVLRLVKTGYAGLPADAADRLEVYLAAFAPRGAKAWAKEWMSGQDTYDLEGLNRSRKTVHGLVQDLARHAGGRKASGSRWARALYELLLAVRLDERLGWQAAELKALGLLEEAAVTERIWNAAVDLLDQLDEIIGEEILDAKGFREILQSGFESVEEGILPTGADQVQVGSIGRSKYSGLRHMLLLGAVEGSLSESREAGGILSGKEIDTLAGLGVQAGFGRAMETSRRQFALYEAVTKGSAGLYVSWPANGDNLPDRIVRQIMELLMIAPEDIMDAASLSGGPAPAGGAFARLPAMLRAAAEGNAPEDAGAALLHWYLAKPDYSARANELLNSLSGDDVAETLPAANLALGGLPTVSVSQLESYGNCPFRHFVEYVLMPQPWRLHGVEGADAGRFMHAAMERFSARLAATGFNVSGLDEGGVARMMEREADQLAGQFDYGVLRRSARLGWTGDNLKRICTIAAISFLRQLKNGGFRPLGQEIRFGWGVIPAAPLPAAGGAVCYLQGRIDRLDVCRAEDADLLRVIDYKSGRSTIDVYDAVNGLDMQTWLYLHALRTVWGKVGGKQARPAGAYIFPLDNPWVEDGPEPEQERRMELRLRGWCLKDGAVVSAMDADAAGGRSGLFNFNLQKGSGLFPEPAVDAALDLIAGCAGRYVSEMRQGRVCTHPWRSGKETACAGCPYGALCRFRLQRNRQYRQLLDKQTIDRMIGREGGADGDGMDG